MSRKRKAFRAAVLLSMLLFVLPDMYSLALGKRCGSWNTRDWEHSGVTLSDVASASVLTSTASVPVLPLGAEGTAVPGLVLFTSSPDLRLWIHEMAHQAQMRHLGILPYSIRYAREYMSGRFAGCGPSDAKDAISFELEADALAEFSDPPALSSFAAGHYHALARHMLSLEKASEPSTGQYEALASIVSKALSNTAQDSSDKDL